MRILHSLTALAILFVVALSAHAQVDLKWKFKEDDRFFVKEENIVKQTMEYLGARIPSETKMTLVHSFTVKKIDKDGIVLEQKIESAEVKHSFDPKVFDALADALRDSTFTVTLDPSGKVTKYEGYDELLRKFGKLSESTAKMIKSTVTEESLRQQLVQLFSFAPAKQVKQGESWTQESKTPFGPLGSFKTESKFTFSGKGSEGTDRNLQMIGVQSSMAYVPPPRDDDSPLKFKIVGGDLKADNARTTIAFDLEKGRLARFEFSMSVKGEIKIEAGGKESTCKIEQEQTIRSWVLDKRE